MKSARHGFSPFLLTAAILLLSLAPLFADEQEDLAAALDHAIRKEDIAAATSLLEAGVDPNGFTSRYQETFLMVAALKGNVQMTQLFLDHGADPNARNTWGGSAAHYANGRNSEEILRLLASKGGRFDVITTNERAYSPLMEHIKEERTMKGIVFLLDWEEEHSPDFAAGFKSRKDYYTALLTLLLAEYDRSDYVPKLSLAERLLNSGADAAAKNSNGTPIVFFAVSYSNLRSGLLPLLVEWGAPVNEFDYNNETLLIRATDREAYHLVSFLLDHGADPNLRNEKGKTALMYARTIVTAKYLLAAGADPNLQDKNGETALFHAWLHPQIIIPLLEGGADASHTDLRGNTVLHRWGYIQDDDILEALLSRGCPLDQPNHNGLTPLMSAARSGRGKAVLSLLEKGADATRRDNSGTSVICHYLRNLRGDSIKEMGSYLIDADKEKLETVVAALLAAGADPADTNDKGNSALLYVMNEIKYTSGDTKYLKLIRDMMLEHTDKDDVKAARAVIAKEYREELGEYLPTTFKILSWPLIVGGISVGMREGVYADNKSENFLGPVNGYLTLTASGFFLGFMIGAANFESSGAWADMFGPVVEGFFGGVIGLIGGVIIACLPPVRRAFTDIPVLYYAPTGMSALAAGIIIFKIWH